MRNYFKQIQQEVDFLQNEAIRHQELSNLYSLLEIAVMFGAGESLFWKDTILDYEPGESILESTLRKWINQFKWHEEKHVNYLGWDEKQAHQAANQGRGGAD